MMGVGVEKDPAAAEKWFEKSAKQHNPQGEYAMGTLYSNVPSHAHDIPKAAVYFRSSARAGYVLSMHSLGLLLVNHPEVPQQAGEASDWLQAAAAGGSWRSSAILGVLARDGRRGPADHATACRWFTIAAQQGRSEIANVLNADLANCKAGLSPDEQRQAEQIAAGWVAAHPHQDIFEFADGAHKSYFPLMEVYATDQAQAISPVQAASPEGATIH
jgi:TPR repeat protein